MQADLMMRPTVLSDAVIGPFIEPGMLDGVISELGRLAVMVGEDLEAFMPGEWMRSLPSRVAFAKLKKQWLTTFYGVG